MALYTTYKEDLAAAYQRALELTDNSADQNFLKQRLVQVLE